MLFFHITLKSSHSFYALCITVNLCLFTDKYIFFIFRMYCNKNNTFPSVGHFVPLKILFNSSPGCVFLLRCCRHIVHRQEIHITVCIFFFSLSPLVFVVGQHSVSLRIHIPPHSISGDPAILIFLSISFYFFYELTQEQCGRKRWQQPSFLEWSCGRESQTNPPTCVSILR